MGKGWNPERPSTLLCAGEQAIAVFDQSKQENGGKQGQQYPKAKGARDREQAESLNCVRRASKRGLCVGKPSSIGDRVSVGHLWQPQCGQQADGNRYQQTDQQAVGGSTLPNGMPGVA
jgi:hypothetical protein